MKEYLTMESVFYIPNIIIVGAGRTQTIQHQCLKCSTEFFCFSTNLSIEDLFCDDCSPDSQYLGDENISSVNYIGNIKGWKQIIESDQMKRRTRNYKKVFIRDNFTCQYCQYNYSTSDKLLQLHIDHIKPFSASGSHAIKNLCVSCAPCNLIASNKWFQSFEDKKNYIMSQRKIKNIK